jgi:AcrR family transcriptional regulator
LARATRPSGSDTKDTVMTSENARATASSGNAASESGAGVGTARVTPIAGRSARTRDPARKQRILAAAADLMARNGFSSVSMEDIGDAVGITASAIYRHYGSKNAVLVAMFDRVIDRLLSQGQQVAADREADPREALRQLIDGQIDFVVDDRDVAQVYFREIANLPEADRRSLRRKQRLYLEEWVHLLTELRPGLSDSAARTVVHCAIGAIQATLQHAVGLPEERLRELLRQSAIAVLTAGPE